MSPQEAQALVDRVLQPELWEIRNNVIGWEESLPEHYHEPNHS